MAARPGVNVLFKDDESGITIDYRVRAKGTTSADMIAAECLFSYADLVEKVREKWGHDKDLGAAGPGDGDADAPLEEAARRGSGSPDQEEATEEG